MLTRRVPWTRQPQGPTRLNSSWRSLGLVRAYVPGGQVLTTAGAPTTVVNQFGHGFSTQAGGDAYIEPFSTSLISGADRWTIVAAFATTQATTPNGRCIYSERPNATQIIKMTVGANDNFARIVVRNSSSVLTQAIGTSNVRDGTPKVVAGVRYADTDHRIFVNGVQEVLNTGGVGNLFGTAATPYIGNDQQDATTSIFTGGIALVALFREALQPAQIKSLADNPWQLFEPRQIYIPTAEAASGPTVLAVTPTTIGSTSHRPRYTWTPA